LAIRTINPATGEWVRNFEALTDFQIAGKIRLAEQTFPKFRALTFAERGAMMRKKRKRKEQKTNDYMANFRKTISHKCALHSESIPTTVVGVCGSGRFITRSRRLPDKHQTES